MKDENVLIEWAAKTVEGYAIPIKVPEYSNWQATIAGNMIVWRPEKGREPNAFHRLMQRLILGIKWERVKP